MNIYSAITGLTELMSQNNYNKQTINSYSRVWKKLANYLIANFNTEEFTIEHGLQFLESEYRINTKYDKAKLTEREVQLIRYINMLEDYKLYGVLTRRFYSKKATFLLNENYIIYYEDYLNFINLSDYSKCTKEHYSKISKTFIDYLQQKKIFIEQLNISVINDYIITLSGYSYKKIELELCGIRNIIRYFSSKKYISNDFSSLINMPKMSKQAKLPSAWSIKEIKAILSAIDRNSPIGKRDYAMILLATLDGIRSSDIKKLKFNNIDWRNKSITFVQSKTKTEITVALNKEVGWAIIDYIKNARPKFYETDYIFIKHMPPFDTFSKSNHLSKIVKNYATKARLDLKNHKAGFHTLRHTAATLLLENGENIPVISGILGHSSIDITAVYLKNNLNEMRECVLDCDWEIEVYE